MVGAVATQRANVAVQARGAVCHVACNRVLDGGLDWIPTVCGVGVYRRLVILARCGALPFHTIVSAGLCG